MKSDDKLYRLRFVIPRTAQMRSHLPQAVLQYSSSTGARNNDDFLKNEINQNDYDFEETQVVSVLPQMFD